MTKSKPKISAEERKKILNKSELKKLLKTVREDRKAAVKKVRELRKMKNQPKILYTYE
jgi:hypothetical protein